MLGLFGGSFDPIHEGHLHLAGLLADRYALSRVHFVPARQNPLKSSIPGAGPKERLAMVEAALADAADPRFSFLDWEVTSHSPSYTVLTVERCRALQSESLCLFMGNEVFKTLPRWFEPARLMRQTHCAVATRTDEPCPLLGVLHAIGIHDGVASSADRVVHSGNQWVERVPIEPLPYSSTQLRQALADWWKAGGAAPFPSGLSKSVAEYVKKKRLYAVE